MNNLAEVVLGSVARHHARPLFRAQTYGSVLPRMRAYNALLDRHRVGSMDRVCLLADKCVDWVSLMASCWARGAVFVPLVKNNPALTQHIVRTVRPKVVVSDDALPEPVVGNAHDPGAAVIPRRHPALILFTSGSTGNPKGVVLSHGNILANLSMMGAVLGDTITPTDRSYSILPWHHCYGLVCELLYLVGRGASIHTPSSMVPETVLAEMAGTRPTLFFTVPKVLEAIYKKDVRFVPSFVKRNYLFGPDMRMMSVGGALCNRDLVAFMTEGWGVPTYQGYGMTETSPLVSLCTPTHNRIGSVGRLLPQLEARFHTDGTLSVRGETCMLGYYQGEEDGRIVCQGVDGWWDTGDRGYVDADGFLYIQGRAKTEYKLSNGKYVDPVYIGSLMSMVPGVDQAVVFGEGEAYNRAVVYSREGVSLQTVQSFLQGRVEPYEVPREIYFVEEPFSVQNGLLTQKLEPNRQKILAQFQKHDS